MSIETREANTPGMARAFLLALIRCYQKFISPLFGSQCRFYPCCSNYAIDAIEEHGCLTGCYLSGRRLLRCHPLCEGGYDPVPPRQTNSQK